MKVTIYARVSTERQEKQETIQSQLAALREFAKANNYTIIDEYIDDGYSGEMFARPALDRLRDDAPKGLFEAVLVHCPDRFSRKYIYQGLITEELKKCGIKIIFLNRPQSGDSPEDHLLNGVQGLIAEYEKAKILERTRRGKLHKAKTGLIITSTAPYGYRYILRDRVHNKDGYYEVASEEAVVVKMIFDLFVNKQMGIRTIAKELTYKGIMPRKGKHWRTSTLHKIIRNETYVGVTYYNKHIASEPCKLEQGNSYRRRKNSSMRLRPIDQWIPIQLPEHLKIIDREIFDLAQAQLKKNNEYNPRDSKYQYLLRGLVVCGDCGSPYLGTPSHSRLYYRCGNRHRTFPLPKECNAPTRRASILEGLVWDALSEAIQHPCLIIEQAEKLYLSKAKQSKSAEGELERIETALANIYKEEDRLLDAYRGGAITLDQLKTQMGKIQDKRGILSQEKQRLVQIATQTLSPDLLKRGVKDYCEVIKTRFKKVTFEEKQQILKLLVNKIVLERERVRIKGVIPSYQTSGCIPSTVSSCSGRRGQEKA